MAKRNILHKSKLENLKKWLIQDGWELLPLSNNPYEVLRAIKSGKQYPLIIYSRKSDEHYSFADRDMSVIGAFLRDMNESPSKSVPATSHAEYDQPESQTGFREFAEKISVLKKIRDHFTYNPEDDPTAPTLELDAVELKEILNLYESGCAMEDELRQYKMIAPVEECQIAINRVKMEDIDARR